MGRSNGSAAPEGGIRVLPERWAGRVSDFIRSAGTAEEAAADGRPEMMFGRMYLPAYATFYADFNIRSRHFRCLETFFVDTGPNDEIGALVSLSGLRTAHRVGAINLIVARPPADDPGSYVAGLLDRVLDVTLRYSAVSKLRLSYVYDTSLEAAVGVRISNLFVRPPAHLPLIEEARLPNETGRNREAVLLAFQRPAAVSAREAAEAP